MKASQEGSWCIGLVICFHWQAYSLLLSNYFTTYIKNIDYRRKVKFEALTTVSLKSMYFGMWHRVSWRKVTAYLQEDITSISKAEEAVYIIFYNEA
jgi:hypothetical protein